MPAAKRAQTTLGINLEQHTYPQLGDSAGAGYLDRNLLPIRGAEVQDYQIIFVVIFKIATVCRHPVLLGAGRSVCTVIELRVNICRHGVLVEAGRSMRTLVQLPMFVVLRRKIWPRVSLRIHRTTIVNAVGPRVRVLL